VLHPREVAGLLRRGAGDVPLVRVGLPLADAPLFEREGRVGDDAVELGQGVARQEFRLPQGVAAGDLEVFDVVEQQVHPGDAGRGQVLLLPEEFAEHGPRVAARPPDVIDGGEQHAAGAAGRVVNRFAGARGQ